MMGAWKVKDFRGEIPIGELTYPIRVMLSCYCYNDDIMI